MASKKRKPRPDGTRRTIRNVRELTTLRTIVAKLQFGYFDQLTHADGILAGNLLAAIADDRDPRDVFHETKVGVRVNPHHRDIALHYQLVLFGLGKTRSSKKSARGIVAKAWGYADTAIPKIVKKFENESVELVALANEQGKARQLTELESRAKQAKT